MSILSSYPEVIRGVKTTADSEGATLKSSMEPIKGKRRQSVIMAISAIVNKKPSKKNDGKGGSYSKSAC